MSQRDDRLGVRVDVVVQTILFFEEAIRVVVHDAFLLVVGDHRAIKCLNVPTGTKCFIAGAG